MGMGGEDGASGYRCPASLAVVGECCGDVCREREKRQRVRWLVNEGNPETDASVVGRVFRVSAPSFDDQCLQQLFLHARHTVLTLVLHDVVEKKNVSDFPFFLGPHLCNPLFHSSHSRSLTPKLISKEGKEGHRTTKTVICYHSRLPVLPDQRTVPP